MRFVNRNDVAEPPSLASADSAGKTELEKARAYYGATPPPKKSYKFKAYTADDVHKALDKLFKGKCAYCETPYQASQPVDVEHYRPKGGVEDDPDHLGYWWLAMRWDNLLASCIDCNRRRRQVTATLGETLHELETAFYEGKTKNSGKKDSFPTRNGIWARTEADAIDNEQPLLIDPTRTNPDGYILWPVEGATSVAVSSIAVDGSESPEGKASIHVYGLNRMGLIQERTKLLLELRVREERLRKLLNVAEQAEAAGQPIDEFLDLAREMAADMVGMTSPESRYSALAVAFVTELRAKLNDLF
ncbi:hypothetical protein ACFWXH_07240 [Mesorhizobium sp. NPDC059054]|uniref:hypothetical protein n=1 Tax=unclassified Mesorhizobium TaxID=325217 RepID=UPI00368EA0E0